MSPVDGIILIGLITSVLANIDNSNKLSVFNKAKEDYFALDVIARFRDLDNTHKLYDEYLTATTELKRSAALLLISMGILAPSVTLSIVNHLGLLHNEKLRSLDTKTMQFDTTILPAIGRRLKSVAKRMEENGGRNTTVTDRVRGAVDKLRRSGKN